MILFNNSPVPFGHFPNGEINIPKHFFKNNYADVRNVVTLKYQGDEDLFRLFLVRKSIWFPCTLRITYFPYSRMDRNSDSYIFTLKSVAKFINMMEWERVIIYEPHSDVTPALINHCTIVPVTINPIMLSKLVNLMGDFQVVFPDAGAQKRYSDYKGSRQPLVGIKHRDFKTGRISNLQVVGDRASDNAVIVDDLCSKGGTFILTAEKLREMGFSNIILIVAHCEKTIFDGEIFTTDLINKVITTDSILEREDEREKLRIIPLTEFKW